MDFTEEELAQLARATVEMRAAAAIIRKRLRPGPDHWAIFEASMRTGAEAARHIYDVSATDCQKGRIARKFYEEGGRMETWAL